MKRQASNSQTECRGHLENGVLSISVKGSLNAESVARLWPDVRALLDTKDTRSIIVECSGLHYADGAGTALLVFMRQVALRREIPLEFQGLEPGVEAMLELYPAKKLTDPVAVKP
jgi:anti-anti-sigma factor